jgi:hypothetical protein
MESGQLINKVKLLEAEKKLLEAERDSLKEYIGRIEPILKNAIERTLAKDDN